MSENKNKQKYNILNKGELIFFFVLFILLISIAFIIAICVKTNELADKPIMLDNWLLYYGTICGSLVGGFITTSGLYITIRQTRGIQIENGNIQLKQEKRIFSNEIETLVAQYITDIGMYFYAQTLRDTENPPEINRRESIHAFRLLEIKLKNISLADELLEKVRYVHKHGCTFDRGDLREEKSKEFEKNMDDLIELTIKFSKNYSQI